MENDYNLPVIYEDEDELAAVRQVESFFCD